MARESLILLDCRHEQYRLCSLHRQQHFELFTIRIDCHAADDDSMPVGEADWLAGVPITLPVVACADADGACVCTVRATATVASSAITAAAEMNLILRDIILCTSRIRRVQRRK